MNNKKIICLLMAMLMLFGVSACDKKENEQDMQISVFERDRSKETIIDDNYRTYYEVFVRSFCDSDGDGIGDINGLTSKLDYIEEMGFNGIWLMPIMPSSTYHKYDITDYYSIDKQYGTLDDFKNLIKECNARNIKVIIDLVFNHTATKHEWFTTATDYLKTLAADEEPNYEICPYAEYYNFEYTADIPSNYYKISGTKWCYEGVFWDQMPDLNLGSEAVRREIEDIVDFWLELGVGGFRLDAAKEYFSGNADKNIEVLDWFSKYVASKDESSYVVAEVWDSYETIKNYYKSGVMSIFDYTFGNNNGQIVKAINSSGNGKAGSNLAKNFVTVQEGYLSNNKNMINAPFLSNHDTGRIAGFVSSDVSKVKLAGALNLTMSGSAFVYYGEELGMSGSGKDENKRAAMYWSDDADYKGTTVSPPNMETVTHKFASYETQKDDPNSIYNYYRKLISIRNTYPEIARGLVTAMEGIEDGDVCGIVKEYSDSKICIIYNLTDKEKTVSIADSYNVKGMEEFLGIDEKTASFEEGKVTIPPYGMVLLK